MTHRNRHSPVTRGVKEVFVAARFMTMMIGLVLAFLPLAFAQETPATPAATEPTMHKVVEGETLWIIAEKYYGDGKLWPKIWDANKDKVTNAQALTPGEELIIPPKEGEAAAPPAAEAQPQTLPAAEAVTVPPAPVSETPPAEPAPASAPPPAPAAPAGEQPPTVSSIAEATRPLADDADLYCSFYVAEGVDDSTRIVAAQNQDSKLNFDQDDVVFINKGVADGIKNGDEFMAVMEAGTVVHPETHASLGTLFKMLGRVRIDCAYEKTSMGVIAHCCFPMELDTVLRPWEEVPAPIGTLRKTAQCDPPTGRSVGCIVYAQDDVIGLSDGHDVAIDLGSRDGVAPGDVFTIYRDKIARHETMRASMKGAMEMGGDVSGLPRWVLGNLVVVLTQEKTSTARISGSTEEVAVGDKVELQQ
ncbi:MAG: LysM peptidoglycan-binding domain-containing protein [Acidobacteriota bacterium]